jgi:hypothetical protein
MYVCVIGVCSMCIVCVYVLLFVCIRVVHVWCVSVGSVYMWYLNCVVCMCLCGELGESLCVWFVRARCDFEGVVVCVCVCVCVCATHTHTHARSRARTGYFTKELAQYVLTEKWILAQKLRIHKI